MSAPSSRCHSVIFVHWQCLGHCLKPQSQLFIHCTERRHSLQTRRQNVPEAGVKHVCVTHARNMSAGSFCTTNREDRRASKTIKQALYVRVARSTLSMRVVAMRQSKTQFWAPRTRSGEHATLTHDARVCSCTQL